MVRQSRTHGVHRRATTTAATAVDDEPVDDL
jgi:hypothetical protein